MQQSPRRICFSSFGCNIFIRPEFPFNFAAAAPSAGVERFGKKIDKAELHTVLPGFGRVFSVNSKPSRTARPSIPAVEGGSRCHGAARAGGQVGPGP